MNHPTSPRPPKSGHNSVHIIEPTPTDDQLDFDVGEPDTPRPPTDDPYDPDHLGLAQDFAAEAKVKKQFDIVKVEKPSKTRVFRVHPEWHLRALLLVLKEDNETYLVMPALREALASSPLCCVCELLPCVTKAGTPFLWALPMAGADGKWNAWHESAWRIAQRAKERWARMESNREAGCYVGTFDQRPPDKQTAADWPDMPFKEWLRLAFQNFTIGDIDHPVLKRLRLED